MTRTITYRQALNEALAGEMRADPGVFVYGIDVADHKAIFGSVEGLVKEFGPNRCFSTPLSEEAMTGFGLGAAISGMRPVHIHIRVDFFLLAMNQLVNMVSNFQYGTLGQYKVPLVIRAVIGRGWGQAYQHSKSMQSWFAHIPGLKVVMPSTPSDAKGMLISAIRDDNPVIFIEHRWLYDVSGPVADGAQPIPLDRALRMREGKDITIIATSWMNVEAHKAAEVLKKKQGVEVEIVDTRSISHFDEDTIIESVVKTGHCIVADYDWLHCGFSAEVAARVYEAAFGQLKSPIQRIGFANTHCPTTRPLENIYYPNAVTLIRAVEKALQIPETDLSGENFYTYENNFKGPF